MKFTLGAALLFEEISGKGVKSLGEEMGLSDMVKLIYAQQYWDKADRPSLEDFSKEIGGKEVNDLAAMLDNPFSPPAAQ